MIYFTKYNNVALIYNSIEDCYNIPFWCLFENDGQVFHILWRIQHDLFVHVQGHGHIVENEVEEAQPINVLETMFSKKVNPVILDEPFNDLDASNRERVVDLLEKIATNRNIVVVDHASEAKSMFSDVTKIVKRNGVSSLV